MSLTRVRNVAKEVSEQAGYVRASADVWLSAPQRGHDQHGRCSAYARDLARTHFLSRGHVKPDRTGEDLLFEVLLDWGLELSMPSAAS